jgi:hypothetical protein
MENDASNIEVEASSAGAEFLTSELTAISTETASTEIPATADYDPVETAAKNFTEMLSVFKNAVDSTAGRKSLARVLKEIVEFPLAGRQPRLINNHERMLFWMFQELVTNKSIVLADIMKKRMNNNPPSEVEAAERNVSNGETQE